MTTTFRKSMALALAGLMTSGCATFVNHPNQRMNFSSTPTGATVTVNDEPKGTTPVVVKLVRKERRHVVRFELAGHQPYEVTLKRRLSWWILGNVLLGGIAGLALDMITGSLYTFGSDKVRADLKAQGQAAPVPGS